MESVNIDQAKEIVEQVVTNTVKTKNAPNLPIMLHSKPGIGKSSAVRQIAEDNDMNFIDVRLSAMDAADVQGIPHVHEGEMKFSTPSWFPEEDGKPTIVFFDEINNAPNSVQQAAYRLILDREIHNGRKFHDNVVIVAAGNHKEDKTGAKQMLPALANRFAIHMNVVEDKDVFVGYALERGLNYKLMGFLEWQPKYLHVMPKTNEAAFPSPRSWEVVANHLDVFGDNPKGNYGLSVAVTGAVGQAAANSFMAYLKFFQKLPNFKNIMDGKETYEVPKDDVGIQFAVTTAMVQHAAENIEDKKRCENLLTIYNDLPSEHQILFVKQLKTVMGKDRMKILQSPFAKLKDLKRFLK